MFRLRRVSRGNTVSDHRIGIHKRTIDLQASVVHIRYSIMSLTSSGKYLQYWNWELHDQRKNGEFDKFKTFICLGSSCLPWCVRRSLAHVTTVHCLWTTRRVNVCDETGESCCRTEMGDSEGHARVVWLWLSLPICRPRFSSTTPCSSTDEALVVST